MASSSPSVVVVHSSTPGHDCDVLEAILPRRYRRSEDIRDRVVSFLSSEKAFERILLVPTPGGGLPEAETDTETKTETKTKTETTNRRSTQGAEGSSVSVSDDNEFETVLLTTTTTKNNTSTNGNGNGKPRVSAKLATSFASLILDSHDEFRSMVELVADQMGLTVEQTRIESNSHSKSNSHSASSLSLAKFVLPGGCQITLSTAPVWTILQAQSRIVDFMTTAITITTGALGPVSDSASSTRSKSSTFMRRTLSMPNMVPPMVTTTTTTTTTNGRNNNNGNNKQNARQENIVIFPTLETKVLSFDGNYEPFPLNSQTPIPIETELFSGKLLLICRPNENPAKTDPYWNERIFSKKKRRVVMQLQGKLKHKPAGAIFAGMEISDPMKLGLIASGLCNLILKMIKSQGIHYSFGTKDEKAHICFPASEFFDTFIVTPPGETPPSLGGIDIEGESEETVATRKACKTKIDWNTEDTYTMSFHSMYVDFPSWSVVSLPGGRDVSLQTFWGNSLASVVLYEVPIDTDTDTAKPHRIADTKYLVSVRLKALGKDAAAARLNAALLEHEQSDDGEDTSELENEFGGESISTAGDAALMPAFDEDDSEYDNGYDQDEIDTTMFFDTMESLPFGEGVSSEISATSSHNVLLSVIDAFCPCWIEMLSKRGRYVKLYAFCGTKATARPVFRTEEMAEKVFKGDREENAEVDDRFSHRVSSSERTRRILGWKYAEAHTMERDRNHNQLKLRQFHKIQCRFDANFLKRKEPNTTKVTGVKSGFVARALSDRHWKEERMVLAENTREILFHQAEGSKIHARIPLSSVIAVSILTNDTEILPLPTYYYLQIETFVHVTYVMFRSKEERDSWLDALCKALQNRRSTRSFATELFTYEDPVQELLTKSSMWNCQKRKILNCRRYSFRTPRFKTPKETLQLAERALAKVLSLKPKGANDSDLREFLDFAAALKQADAHSLNEEEKCAFFLNVYHIMIMHSYIILGPPVSGTEWVSYFNNIAYQCSDDIFSLAELEHNIIRAKMTFPSSFLSRFILPKSQYHFALVRPDFRLNFALNPGSLSVPTSAVPIYKAEMLNQQLNNITEEYLGYTVYVRPKGRSDVQITLPRVCQWFAEDFGPNASASDVVFAIEPFLGEEKKDALRSIWNSKKKTYDIGLFGLKYLPFSYECRFLTASSES